MRARVKWKMFLLESSTLCSRCTPSSLHSLHFCYHDLCVHHCHCGCLCGCPCVHHCHCVSATVLKSTLPTEHSVRTVPFLCITSLFLCFILNSASRSLTVSVTEHAMRTCRFHLWKSLYLVQESRSENNSNRTTDRKWCVLRSSFSLLSLSVLSLCLSVSLSLSVCLPV